MLEEKKERMRGKGRRGAGGSQGGGQSEEGGREEGRDEGRKAGIQIEKEVKLSLFKIK